MTFFFLESRTKSCQSRSQKIPQHKNRLPSKSIGGGGGICGCDAMFFPIDSQIKIKSRVFVFSPTSSFTLHYSCDEVFVHVTKCLFCSEWDLRVETERKHRNRLERKRGTCQRSRNAVGRVEKGSGRREAKANCVFASLTSASLSFESVSICSKPNRNWTS